MTNMKTIIIGVGNPMLTDDSVGIKVARALRERLDGHSGIEISELYAGGIRLMDVMIGYDKAVIIDAILTSNGKPGTIYTLSPSDLIATRNTLSTHDTNLSIALEMGRMLELPLPSDIKIWAIEAKDVNTFSENLTEDVERAVPMVVERIIADCGL